MMNQSILRLKSFQKSRILFRKLENGKFISKKVRSEKKTFSSL
jgi:hypothetical protein